MRLRKTSIAGLSWLHSTMTRRDGNEPKLGDVIAESLPRREWGARARNMVDKEADK